MDDLAIHHHLARLDKPAAHVLLHRRAKVTEHADKADDRAARLLRGDVHRDKPRDKNQQAAEPEPETGRADQLLEAVLTEQQEITVRSVRTRRQEEDKKSRHLDQAV